MQPAADSNKIYNASSFDDKPSSTFQLVVASVDWISKAVSNKPFGTLRLDRIKSKMPFTFQLIVGSKQLHQRTLQQFLVDVWFTNAISNHGPNQHKSSCASLLAVHAKCLNSHESSCAALLAARAKCLSHESSADIHYESNCTSQLVVCAQCLKSLETSCVFKLVVRAKCHNSNVFTFRLIVGFMQQYQSQLQQDLVDLSLLNTFSIAKLDSISITAKSNSAMLINMPTSQQKAMIHFYDGSSQFIVKYIYSLDSEGAHTSISCNETPFRALELIVVSTLFANFQLIVDLFLI
jgi:hypothetical protein